MNKQQPQASAGKWTDEQWQAITCRERNILVAAGAGAGKTRVLIERVLRRITDPKDPVEIDRLLVVTFTNAAAQEMKERLHTALEEKIKENPRSPYLRRQILMLNRAAISTVHSFCMDVLRRYYYLHDLDPSFRILDETEAELLQQELLEEILEEFYAEAGEGSPFYTLVDAYTTDRGDYKLQELVQKLYRFSRSHPWPEEWLRRMTAGFALESGVALAETSWVKMLQKSCILELEGIVRRYERAFKHCLQPGGPEPYLETLQAEAETFRQLLETARRSWLELYEGMQVAPFKHLKPCRGVDFDPLLKDRVTAIRDSCKKDFQRLQEELFKRPLEEQAAELKNLAPVMETLVALVEAFALRYQQAKKEKGALDFPDLEHFALKILLHPGSSADDLRPSEAALDYRQRFEEVLIDEYQDINAVQETILKLVSRPGHEGNRFMVGDVKQSIYRFRLAEPGLFLEKYNTYSRKDSEGECIRLTRNFRSRRQVLAAVNYLFRQIMDPAVGEIPYDAGAKLVYGASYPDYPEGEGGRQVAGKEQHAVEFLCIDRERSSDGKRLSALGNAGNADSRGADAELLNEEEWDMASLEGRLIAAKIKEMCGEEGGDPYYVYDKREAKYRPLQYRDIVILLRSAQNWASAILEELHLAGIPSYAELSTGYFEATEVQVMLSLLRVIDNPYQDLPLTAVLRSPLVGLEAEELVRIRIRAPQKSFFQALKAYVDAGDGESGAGEQSIGHSLAQKLREFLENLSRWQEKAQQGALADLIWQLYTDTGYFDLVGGMPGGKQRQANLRALYDRARQYEATSFRGLFRFLRFIERLQERGGDLGAARALGEQENLVRIITVHKSKGLEFPVVFVAGLRKQFNIQDLNSDFLLHRELGFGPKYVDPELRLVYPTLPWLAVKRVLQAELLAEEMRILYVAMTRAEEKLFLVATLKDLAREAQKWAELLQENSVDSGHGEEMNREKTLLPLYCRARVRCYLDWIAPALLRHPRAEILREAAGVKEGSLPLFEDEAGDDTWSFSLYTAEEVIGGICTAERNEEGRPEEELTEGEEGEEKHEETDFQGAEKEWWQRISRMEPLPYIGNAWMEIEKRLSWSYPHRKAAESLAKVSVSELKRRWHNAQEALLGDEFPAGDMGDAASQFIEQNFSSLSRPRFLGKKELSASERGSAFHAVMQHLQLIPTLTAEGIAVQIEKMVEREQLAPEEGDAVDPDLVARFFATPLGQRVLKAEKVWRELPFSMALPAREIHPHWPGGEKDDGEAEGQKDTEESVLVQGVIDCLFLEKAGNGLVMIDFKTDSTSGVPLKELEERYRIQLQLYARAVERIWKEKVGGKYLYFFQGGHLVAVD